MILPLIPSMLVQTKNICFAITLCRWIKPNKRWSSFILCDMIIFHGPLIFQCAFIRNNKFHAYQGAGEAGRGQEKHVLQDVGENEYAECWLKFRFNCVRTMRPRGRGNGKKMTRHRSGPSQETIPESRRQNDDVLKGAEWAEWKNAQRGIILSRER